MPTVSVLEGLRERRRHTQKPLNVHLIIVEPEQ
jgi:hypothetical protein